MNRGFAESTVEQAALAWLASSGFAVSHGPDIAFGQPGAERSDPTYRDVVLEWRLREALVRLNANLPQEALDDAFRKIARVEGASVIERNRAVHRMLVDGVTVEYRRADGSTAGAQARVIDFEDPACYPAPTMSSQCYADQSNHCWAVDTMTSTSQFLG